MGSTSVHSRSVLVTVALILGLALASPTLNAAATVWLITFTIDEGYSVHGDGLAACELAGPPHSRPAEW